MQQPTNGICGAGRLLAAEVPHELPQVGIETNKDEELIQKQYNNTQVDHNKYKESTKPDENDAVTLVLAYLNFFQCQISEVAAMRKMMITTVLAYFNFFQCKTTDGAEYTARYNVRKTEIVIVLAYLKYFQCRTTEVVGYTARYNVRKMTIVTAPTYLNFLRNQPTEDTGIIKRYYAGRVD